MDIFSATKRSDIMRKVRSRNTTPERIAAGILESFGLGFDRNYKKLPGSPDIVLRGKKIAIFVHGCF
jgi:DNA mismatch endonuclease (patch repair protein)